MAKGEAAMIKLIITILTSIEFWVGFLLGAVTLLAFLIYKKWIKIGG